MALSSTAQSNEDRRSPSSRIAPNRLAAAAPARAPNIPATALSTEPASTDGNGAIALLTDRDAKQLNMAALQQQLAERSAAARLLTRQVQALTDKSSAAAAKIGEVENELAWAREELVHRDNEIGSLQRSLELTTAETTRLSNRLAGCEASIGKAYVQLEQMKAALIAAERDRAMTASAADRADQKRRNETGSLNARLEAMTSCATTADKLLAGMRQNLREKLELLQNLLVIKDGQLDELKQSRSKLIERTAKLLETFKTRDEAIAAAEEKNRRLAARLAQSEAAAQKRQKALTMRLAQAEAALRDKEEEFKNARLELQTERKKRRIAEASHDEARGERSALERKLDDIGTADDDFLTPSGPRSADMLLATTISL